MWSRRHPAAITGYPKARSGWYSPRWASSAFIGQLDASIVAARVPALQEVFHASVSAVTSVGLTFLLVLVTTVTAISASSPTESDKEAAGRLPGSSWVTLRADFHGPAPSSVDAFGRCRRSRAAILQADGRAIIYLAMPRGSLGRGVGMPRRPPGDRAWPSGLRSTVTCSRRADNVTDLPHQRAAAHLVGMAAAWCFVPRRSDLPPRVRLVQLRSSGSFYPPCSPCSAGLDPRKPGQFDAAR